MTEFLLYDGKYTYINDDRGQRALRYGEEWRDLTGDGFVLAMAQRIEEDEASVKALNEEVERLIKVKRDMVEALEAARKSLPDDPGLNKPWSKCIAILDETIAEHKWPPRGRLR